MQLDKIITLANENTRLRFLAMERSLRATGCKLPLWVIPYDGRKFDLPDNAKWWELKNVSHWLNGQNAHKTMRKYQCLLERNYQFVDTDVIFLKNPELVLNFFSGFITSCGHWHNPGHTTTKEILDYFSKTTTIWQQKVFNSGQFACDQTLYDYARLKETAELPAYKPTCLDFKYHEQPGLNLLVNISGVPITNITLQPYYMESTWAGDYTDSNYERFWKDEGRKPYIIHWAGCDNRADETIDNLIFDFLTLPEKEEWNKIRLKKKAKQNSYLNRIKQKLKKTKSIMKS